MEVDVDCEQQVLQSGNEQEVISKSLLALEQVCLQLKQYLGQHEAANAKELAQVKGILADVFNRAEESGAQASAAALNSSLN